MSETLNVNVIVAAKEEYTKQLITLLQPEMYELIKNIFINSQKNNIRRSLSYLKKITMLWWFQLEIENLQPFSDAL